MAVTVLALPINMVAGLFGMNVGEFRLLVGLTASSSWPARRSR
jgi:Mg2+ and Co2+ transporter CorA